jgi:hypothetical protein
MFLKKYLALMTKDFKAGERGGMVSGFFLSFKLSSQDCATKLG